MAAAPPPERDQGSVRRSWVDRRRDRVVAEIQRNRRGEYTVPTWVLAVLLGLIVVGWLALVIVA